ncbi:MULTISPECIES: ABC transporter substrate binding protein [unclassified Sulfurospirillum]|uniref:sensor histidine kinase n=1 Tax=unclassified Sulfurospirillum TaxID=2618290 RepID=UPI000503B5A7|nr:MULTISPECIES: ABC transporter substrate binding protein [unclassified Sulfurospirillum]KFL34354.1 histidine kinase [Sulfurospirillum sp. SCADC]
MKKIFLLCCLSLGVLLAQNTKDILIIQSYHKGYKWSDDISKTIEKNFSNQENIFISTVYMDTKRIDTPEYLEEFYRYYKERFSHYTFDIVIAVDNSALAFVKEHYEELFSHKTPIVFVGINNFEPTLIDGIKNISGVVENVDIEKNIDLMITLQPNLDKILIINEKTITGDAIRKEIDAVSPKYESRIEIEHVDSMDMDEIASKTAGLSKNSAILWVLLFKDKTGRFFTYKDNLQQIRKITHIPIYGLWDFYLDYGIVGGFLTSATAQAEAASKIVDQIFAGKDPQTIPIVERSPNRYLFDYKELTNHQIDPSPVLKNYEVINKPFSFYEEYKHYIWLFAAIFSAIIMIILFLMQNVRIRKQSEMALKNQLEFIKVLLDTIPNPIYFTDVEGKYIGSNMAFAKLYDQSKEEIIGKSIFDFFPKEWASERRKSDVELLAKKGSDMLELMLHLPKKRARLFTLSKAVYSNIDGSVGGIVCIMDDMTERVQQQQFLIQQSKLTEMGEMIAGVAHQWNEPLVELSAIMQDMEFCFNSGEMDRAKMKEFVRDAIIQIQYMSQTLKDFRNFLKPSTKKTLFCAKKALNEVLEIIGRQIFYAHIDLNVTYLKEAESFPVYGYENEFKQVLINVINNAKIKLVKAHKGGKISIEVDREMIYTKIIISDDGGFIPEKIIGFIFDPYFTTNKNGTGLGLYMAKMIIEDKMGGSIRVQNKDTSTVEFTILVPNANKGSE